MNTKTKTTVSLARLATIVLLAATIGAQPIVATTYLSVEPIPAADLVGTDTLNAILGAGYPNLETWSTRLLNECRIVQDVIDVLTADGAIPTINAGNASAGVAAGGFEGVTNPSYVFTIQDSEDGAASAADVTLLSNALGYVLNQGGTAHFSPDRPKAYDFALDYAVVTFAETLAGVDAKAFFDHLGTIDEDLWSGLFAGFTQIAFGGSSTNNSMLFLKPATSKRRLIDGLSEAVVDTAGATYATLNNNGRPTTAKAGIGFPENDWAAFPEGQQYLANLGGVTPGALGTLATLRLQHLEAVDSLAAAIAQGTLSTYLGSGFTCPGP